MDIKDTLFQSLLRKQNISDFLPFNINPTTKVQIGDRIVTTTGLFGYIKDSSFHVCDEHFTEVCINMIDAIDFKNKGIIHIGITEEQYVYPCENCEKSIVIKTDGAIVYKDPKEYFFISDNAFLIDAPLFLNDFGANILYNFVANRYIFRHSFNQEIVKSNLNKVEIFANKSATLIENGVCNDNLQYLFSIKEKHGSSIWMKSYFRNKVKDTLAFFETDNYGRTKRYEVSPVCMWYTGDYMFIVDIELQNECDDNGFVVLPDKNAEYPVTFEFSVNRHSFGSITLMHTEPIYEKAYIRHFIESLEFSSTENVLLVYSQDSSQFYCDFHTFHVIFINDKGKITYNDELRGKNIELTESNLLRIETEDVEFHDIKGNILCNVDKYEVGFHIFRRYIENPTRFNPAEIALEELEPSYEGVVDLQTGSVVVPPCFSEIQLYSPCYPFDANCQEENNESKHVSIVKIDNYVGGRLSSYHGAYLDDRLIVPICYSKIEMLTSKVPKSGTFRYDEESNFKNVNSNFLLLQKDNLFGIAEIGGALLIEPCADSALLLEDNKCHETSSNGSVWYSYHHIPTNNKPEYAALCKNGLYNLVYKSKIVSDFCYSDLKIQEFDVRGGKRIFVKVTKNDKTGIVFEGNLITNFYSDIQPWRSLFVNKDKENPIVFVAKDADDYYGVLNWEGEIIINFEHEYIAPYRNFVIVDKSIKDISNNEIFNTEGYELVAQKCCFDNERLLCYANAEEYVIIDEKGKVQTYDKHELEDKKQEVTCGGCYMFNAQIKNFEEIIEEEPPYYGDDYNDYDRDTYYALGGDDYDSFRNNGGSIDDMMDGMGF